MTLTAHPLNTGPNTPDWQRLALLRVVNHARPAGELAAVTALALQLVADHDTDYRAVVINERGYVVLIDCYDDLCVLTPDQNGAYDLTPLRWLLDPTLNPAEGPR